MRTGDWPTKAKRGAGGSAAVRDAQLEQRPLQRFELLEQRPMTARDATRLEKCGRFLLHGLRFGASEELPAQLLDARGRLPPKFNPNATQSACR